MFGKDVGIAPDLRMSKFQIELVDEDVRMAPDVETSNWLGKMLGRPQMSKFQIGRG